MLEARQLCKEYKIGVKTLPVLKKVNLTVEKGERLAVVGPSGAGKSTLLYLLSGLDIPTSGTVLFEGRDIAKLNASQRSKLRNVRFGFVFQFYHLLSEFTMLENVMLPALLCARKKRQEIEKKARGILERCGLAARVAHRPFELSGGEQQRVAIARALMNSPDILFCDEPTGNLDSETGMQIKDLLWQLNKEHDTTIILVTHAKELAADATRSIYLKDGELKK